MGAEGVAGAAEVEEPEAAMLARRVPFYLFPSGRFSVGYPGDDHNAVGTFLLEKAGDFDDVDDPSLYQGHLLFAPDGAVAECWPLEPDLSPARWLDEKMKAKVRVAVYKRWQRQQARR